MALLAIPSRRQKSVLVLIFIVISLSYLAAYSKRPILRGVIPLARQKGDADPQPNGGIDLLGKQRPDAVNEKAGAGATTTTRGLVETTQPVNGTHGFNVFDNLYLWNGTLYVVTETPEVFLPREYIVSRPVSRGKGQVETDPTDQEFQFISKVEAEKLFVKDPMTLEGVSFIFYDLDQFMNHFYHWWGELILGSWRVYSALSLKNPPPQTPLPPPRRFILPFISENKWRDPAGVNAPLMRAGFPSSAIEQGDYWKDLVTLGVPVVFERVVLANRVAAHKRHVPRSGQWFKMIASTMDVSAPERFFEPVRRRLVKNALGGLPLLDGDDSGGGTIVSPSKAASDKAVVTYISRQGGHRKLSEDAHESLMRALRVLEKEGLCEVQLPRMEMLSLSEQVRMTARSTIIVGVHGNGLTHQLWMPPSPRSTVIEIMYPGAYVFDYEMLARNLGHKHFAMSNDTSITYPKGTYHKELQYGNTSDFHGNSIPVHGPAVAEIIRRQLQATGRPGIVTKN